MNEALLEQEAFSCWTKVTRINLKQIIKKGTEKIKDNF